MSDDEQTPERERDEDDPAAKAQEQEEKDKQAKEKMKELEEDPPKDLDDWPSDETKYATFGGGEGDHGYHEGPEAKLGPSELRHHEDGSVSISGEKVDDPEEYKGDRIEPAVATSGGEGDGDGDDDDSEGGEES